MSELPDEFSKSLNSSENSDLDIMSAYRIGGEAMDILMDYNTYQMYSSDVGIDELCVIRAMKDSIPMILYFKTDGELYERYKMDPAK